jgi:cytochrome c-type biogenesis protein CcmH/NrfG
MRHVGAVLGLVLLVAAVYGASVGHEFVFDDHLLVVGNPVVRLPLDQAGDVFLGTDAGIAYRPLRMLSYMVDHHVAGGLDPATFHLSNLVYHAAAVLALYALALVTIGSAGGAFCAAAFLAVHPLGSEAVAYVAGRRDVLSTLLVLLALLCWCAVLRAPGIAARGRTRDARLGLGGGAALAGMLLFAVLAIAAKESAVVLPVLAALLWLAQPRSARRDAAPPLLAAIAVCAVALAGVGLWLYAGALGPRFAAVAGRSLAPQPALSLTVLGQYLWLALWPADLSADYRAFAFALPTAPLDGRAIACGLALLLVAGSGTALLLRGAVAGAGLLWFLVALLPVAQVVPYTEVIAEHNAYLALAGLALAVGQGVAVLARRRGRLAAALAACALLALGVRAWVRAQDWRDDPTLWTATIESRPDSVRAHYNLGIAYLARGRVLDARAALDRAAGLAPDDREVLLALATLSGRLGDYERAYELASRAVAERRDAQSLTVLGWAQLSRGEAHVAIETFERAIALGADVEARQGLARARSEGGRF